MLENFNDLTKTDSQNRKQSTEGKLISLGAPVNLYLPALYNRENTEIRTAECVAKRCLILLALLNVIYDNKRHGILQWLKKSGLWEEVSPEEKIFFYTVNPDRKTRNILSWRIEALQVLLWSLGIIPDPVEPNTLCNLEDPELFKMLPDPSQDPAGFIKIAALIDKDQILDGADLIYRIHWAVKDALLNEREIPGGFNPDIVYERHYALKWLTSARTDWDKIRTDT